MCGDTCSWTGLGEATWASMKAGAALGLTFGTLSSRFRSPSPKAQPGTAKVEGNHGRAGEVTVYRVEEPEYQRVEITPDFDVVFHRADKPLFLNFGSRAQAENWHRMRLRQGYDETQIKSFQVEKGFLDWLRAESVHEDLSYTFMDAALRVDNYVPDQFMLRSAHIYEMIKHLVPGSGRVR